MFAPDDACGSQHFRPTHDAEFVRRPSARLSAGMNKGDHHGLAR